MSDWGLGPYIYAGHYALLHHVLTEFRPKGVALEFGVGAGESLRLIAQYMPVIGFDSFEGLPEDWREGFPAGTFACEQPQVDNATIVTGLFRHTLPKFDWGSVGYVGLVHFDADLYTSTRMALQYGKFYLGAGTICVFDEFHGFQGAEMHEQRAWREYVHRSGVEWKVLGHSFQHWAIQIV